ncbi:hypothetical protein AWB83_02208 [Caballeronia ptereochthonis]|uniref:Uncharacterized protein n=1 Tax=Caballeronia ptereochthonis TaxID=1777144 RepID=A0A158AQ06_9BURK|nr:hypothetical protein AWB83_02208 [Caballeronia ptereochthonis]
MHRSRRHVGIGDDRVLGIDGAMVQIEEALGLVVAHHVAALGIGATDLDLFARRRLIVVIALQRLLALRGTVRIDCRIQPGQIRRRRLCHLQLIELVLVGVGLQMRAVAVQHSAIDHAVPDCLAHDLVEDLLIHRRVDEASSAILRERRGVRHLIAQAKAGKPPIRHINLNLAHQLALTAHPEQVADEQQLEQHHRIERRSAVVRAVKMRNLLADEFEIHRRVDLAQQMVLRHKHLERHHLELLLGGCRLLKHDLY